MDTDRTSIGDRMKDYERACRVVLPRRLPVILRVDGKAFHTFTLGMTKPFDEVFCQTMNAVAVGLCDQVQGAQLAYVQSDEVSVLLHNYKRLQTEAWFDNQVQKIVSVAASIASTIMTIRFDRRALFDARVFVLPEAEVCNYFLWRQQDCTRNSVQMLARSLYSHKQCDNKTGPELQEMCFQSGQNWNDLPTWQKRGRFALRDSVGQWIVDRDPPILTQDREYVNRHLAVEEA